MRAQAALEFLTTYGWAIMVVLVAVAALAYFGVLNPKQLLPEKCIVGAGLSCIDYGVEFNANGKPWSISAIFVNNYGTTIRDITMHVYLMNDQCSGSNPALNKYAFYFQTETQFNYTYLYNGSDANVSLKGLLPDERAQLWVDCSHGGSYASGAQPKIRLEISVLLDNSNYIKQNMGEIQVNIP
ncbi:MAG: hypothetical protein V1725_03855 [archaeon]